MSDALTNGEIAVLNAARTILDAHSQGFPDDGGQTRVICAAEHAENAIFRFLSMTNTWGGVPMTQAQVHNGWPGEANADELHSVKAGE